MADTDLTDEEIVGIWQSMPGGPDGWLKYFGFVQFARAVEARIKTPPRRPVAEVERMPGVTGFGIAVFKLSDVPLGTKLYAKEPTP